MFYLSDLAPSAGTGSASVSVLALPSLRRRSEALCGGECTRRTLLPEGGYGGSEGAVKEHFEKKNCCY